MATPKRKTSTFREDHSRAKLENQILDKILETRLWEIDRLKVQAFNDSVSRIRHIRDHVVQEQQFLAMLKAGYKFPGQNAQSKAAIITTAAFEGFDKYTPRNDHNVVKLRPRTAAVIDHELRVLSNFGKNLRKGRARNVDAASLMFDEENRSALVRARSAPAARSAFSRATSAFGGRKATAPSDERIEQLARPKVTTFFVAAQMCAAKLRARAARGYSRNSHEANSLMETEEDRRFKEETKQKLLEMRKHTLLSSSYDIQDRVARFCVDIDHFKRENTLNRWNDSDDDDDNYNYYSSRN